MELAKFSKSRLGNHYDDRQLKRYLRPSMPFDLSEGFETFRDRDRGRARQMLRAASFKSFRLSLLGEEECEDDEDKRCTRTTSRRRTRMESKMASYDVASNIYAGPGQRRPVPGAAGAYLREYEARRSGRARASRRGWAGALLRTFNIKQMDETLCLHIPLLVTGHVPPHDCPPYAADVLTWRGNFAKLLATPWNTRDTWHMEAAGPCTSIYFSLTYEPLRCDSVM